MHPAPPGKRREIIPLALSIVSNLHPALDFLHPAVAPLHILLPMVRRLLAAGLGLVPIFVLSVVEVAPRPVQWGTQVLPDRLEGGGGLVGGWRLEARVRYVAGFEKVLGVLLAGGAPDAPHEDPDREPGPEEDEDEDEAGDQDGVVEGGHCGWAGGGICSCGKYRCGKIDF